MLEIELLRGDGPGTEYQQMMAGPGGKPIRGDYRIVVCSEPTTFEFDVVAGPARPHGAFTITEVSPISSRVTFALTLEPCGAMRLLKPMLSKQLLAEAQSIQNLPRAMGAA